METRVQGRVPLKVPLEDLDRCIERYRQADAAAPGELINALSPDLLRFFRNMPGGREQAADLLLETWMRIHHVRHTYRPGEPVRPWVYAIARRVRVDGYRRTRRIMAFETPMETIPEAGQLKFEAPYPILKRSSRRFGITERSCDNVKIVGLTLEEVARATSSSLGAEA
jgi:RNA polymerase sigma-70 factor, ECF subfamily